MVELYQLTATQALDRIRQGNVTVEEYARALLARIRQRDNVVHAWAHLDPDLVISQARALDSIPAEKRGSLHGLAVGIKDVFLTMDMPTRYNSALYKDAATSNVDAAVVVALRAAGALILGKTATTEFAATCVGGPCTNPHNAQHTPGGSSSGSAAAVADFQVPIALGTQTGGSMVRPGSFNGIYAFKPTWGGVSRDGMSHVSITCDTPGFFARSLGDLEPLVTLFDLADDDPVPRSPFSVSSAKIGFAKTHVWPKAGPGLQAAWGKARSLLKNHGAVVEDIELPEEFAKLKQWHSTVVNGESRASFRGGYLLSRDSLSQQLVDHVENRPYISRKALLEGYDGCAELRPVWDRIASKYDAVIVPSTVDDAPCGLEYTGDAAFCTMWTLLHAPCINIPGFSGEHGLPLGLTAVGPRYSDGHVLHAAMGIGEIFELEGKRLSTVT